MKWRSWKGEDRGGKQRRGGTFRVREQGVAFREEEVWVVVVVEGVAGDQLCFVWDVDLGIVWGWVGGVVDYIEE